MVQNTQTFARFVNHRFVIFERVLDTMKVDDEFRYERFVTEDLAIKALAERGDMAKRYVIIKEYAIVL